MRKNSSTGSTTDRITRVTADRAVESRTDCARVHATTPEEIERQAAQDEAEDGLVVDWDNVTSNRPPPKAVLHMRVDQDVLDFFRLSFESGAADASALGYVPLPQTLVKQVKDYWTTNMKAGS